MIMITLYLFIHLFFFYFDLLPIVRNGYTKLFMFNLIIFFISLSIIVLIGVGVKVPNPNDFIEIIVKSIVG